jgi:hypothetical protein
MFLHNAFIDRIRLDIVRNKGDKGVVNEQVQLGRDIQITQDNAYLNVGGTVQEEVTKINCSAMMIDIV